MQKKFNLCYTDNNYSNRVGRVAHRNVKFILSVGHWKVYEHSSGRMVITKDKYLVAVECEEEPVAVTPPFEAVRTPIGNYDWTSEWRTDYNAYFTYEMLRSLYMDSPVVNNNWYTPNYIVRGVRNE